MRFRSFVVPRNTPLMFDVPPASSDDCRLWTSLLPSQGFRVSLYLSNHSCSRHRLPIYIDNLRSYDSWLKKHVIYSVKIFYDTPMLISEVILNALKGRVPLSPTTMRAWCPQKQTLPTFARRKTSLKKRRDLLMNQKGAGFCRKLMVAVFTPLHHDRARIPPHIL